MTAIAWPGPLRSTLTLAVWQMRFPEVVTSSGFLTPAAAGTAFRPFTHPGSAILLAALLSYALFRRFKMCKAADLRGAASATWRSAAPASIGIIATVGMSTLMEHTGMTQLLARGMANLMGAAFPLSRRWSASWAHLPPAATTIRMFCLRRSKKARRTCFPSIHACCWQLKPPAVRLAACWPQRKLWWAAARSV